MSKILQRCSLSLSVLHNYFSSPKLFLNLYLFLDLYVKFLNASAKLFFPYVIIYELKGYIINFLKTSIDSDYC